MGLPFILQAAKLEAFLAEAESLCTALQSENADLKRQQEARQDDPANTQPTASPAKTVTETLSAAAAPLEDMPMPEETPQSAAAPVTAAPSARRPTGLVLRGTSAEPQCSSGSRRRSEALPLAARTCLLRAQDALLAAASPPQGTPADAPATVAAASATPGAAEARATPTSQLATADETAQLDAASLAALVEDPTLPALPFEGLSQRLSQVEIAEVNHLILFTPTKPQMTAVTVRPYWSNPACLNNETRPEC